MIKREGELKSLFAKELKRQLPHFMVARFVSAGAPDRLIAGNGRVTMWEMKHGTPEFDSNGLQELICMRFATASHCAYVIWQESAVGIGKRTIIATPKAVHERTGWRVEAESWCSGFDMKWLVEQVREAHRV